MRGRAVLEPMLATLVDRLPQPGACRGGCRYEPKWDGYRALAEVDEYEGVTLLSRRARPLTAAFPEIVHGVHEVAPGRSSAGPAAGSTSPRCSAGTPPAVSVPASCPGRSRAITSSSTCSAAAAGS